MPVCTHAVSSKSKAYIHLFCEFLHAQDLQLWIMPAGCQSSLGSLSSRWRESKHRNFFLL